MYPGRLPLTPLPRQNVAAPKNVKRLPLTPLIGKENVLEPIPEKSVLPPLPRQQNVGHNCIHSSSSRMCPQPVHQKSLSLKKSKTVVCASKKLNHLLSEEHQLNSEIPFINLIPEVPQTKCSSHSEGGDSDGSQVPEVFLSNDSSNSIEEKSQEELQSILEGTLPQNYSYKIVSVCPLKVYHSENYDQSEMFQAVLRINVRNKEDTLNWLDEYHMCSYSDWRVRKTFPEDTQRVIFKKGFRCHNNTLAQYRHGTKPHVKQTECKASLNVTVKNFEMKRTMDPYLKSHPLEVVIDHCHNHPLQAADSLRHRRPNAGALEKVKKLFESGHSPSSAMHTFQYDLQMENGDRFFELLADGAVCPNQQWFFYQFYKQFGQTYGAPDGPKMKISLQQFIHKYNESCGSVCAAFKEIDKDIVLVICSPLMKRVHEHLKSSAEIVFLDSGGMMDRQNTRIFTLLAPSVAGALPLGIVMTSSESEIVLTEGMELLMTIVPPNAFYDRGKAGPLIMMTDDCQAERNVVKSLFPSIILLLCLFHVLQAYWRYLWDSKHKVPQEHREEIFFLFKKCCRAENVKDFEVQFQEQLTNPIVASNAILVKHLQKLHDRAPEWALCYRNELMTRGNDTNNYSESTIRRYKDDVLNRLKAYSEVQLFDFFTTRLEAYFERRTAAVLNNRRENYSQSKHFIHPEKLLPLECSKSSHEGVFVVKNNKSGGKYLVDTDMEVCSCPVGKNGAPCKHQQAVVNQFKLSSTQFLPFNDEEAKMTLHKIMTNVEPLPGWYASLKGGPVCSVDLQSQCVSEELSIDNFSLPAIETEEGLEKNESSQHGDTDDDERRNEAMKAWNAVNSWILESLQSRSDVFAPAVLKFTQHFERAKNLSENALLSALHTFNKYDSTSARAVRKGRYIKVNNISVGRRKMVVGGRKCAPQGRPPKTAFTTEHGYAVMNSKKRTAMPHNLSLKIQQQSSVKRRKVAQ